MELIGIDLQIIEVGNNFVDGIPNVHIDMTHAPSVAISKSSVHTSLDGQAPNPVLSHYLPEHIFLHRFCPSMPHVPNANLFQLFPSEDQSLLIRWDPFLVLDLGLDIVDGIG